MKDWWRRQGKWMFAFASACLATIIGINSSWPVIEPMIPAHRGYVRGQVSGEVEKTSNQLQSVNARQIETQFRIDRNERARVLDKIADRELLLQQNPDMPAPARVAIDEQIRSWRDDIRELNYSIDQLQRSREGRRP